MMVLIAVTVWQFGIIPGALVLASFLVGAVAGLMYDYSKRQGKP
jgi:hypothetical protein